MRAVVCRELGPLDTVEVCERDPQVPAAGQVVVEVRAAGVNFVDGLMCQGRYQIKLDTPFVPGGEFAGVVTALGDAVSAVSPGDSVMGTSGIGAFAEQVVVPEKSLTRVPDRLGYGQAAAFIQSYCTAWYTLTRRSSLSAGDWVLVLGAGGGVGLAAVDASVELGARVIAAASSKEKLAAAAAMGASATIAYEDEDLKTRARELSDGGVDLVIDPVGGRHSEPALRALRRFGRFCVIGFAAGAIPALPLNQVLLNNRTVVGVDWGAWAMSDPGGNRRLLEELIDKVSSGRLSPVVPEERPLEDAVAVMSGLLERSISGKVVLIP